MRRLITTPFLSLVAACALSQAAPATDGPKDRTHLDRPKAIEEAPRDTVRSKFPTDARQLMRDLDSYHSDVPTRRIHAQLDRPLYRPGDEVGVRVWDLATRDLGVGANALTVQLLDPQGSEVQRQMLTGGGVFALPADAAGGSWKVVVSGWGTPVERTFMVNNFQAPRIKKTLTFVREGYQPGDTVQAVVMLERATGEILADMPVTTQVRIGGAAQPAGTARTDSNGSATVRFELPENLAVPDVTLSVLADDGGVMESITRPVPVVLDRVELKLFPEGGQLVTGLPSRVYFEAVDVHGKPADVEGRVTDDQGEPVATLRSWVDGRGHVTFTPRPGRTYTAQVERKRGDPLSFGLPAAQSDGCVMHHHDDLDGQLRSVRIGVRCTDSRKVVVMATQQEQIIDRAAFRVTAGKATTVHLQSRHAGLSRAQGVARVTVLDEALQPLAERLVYRNRSQRLSVEITPDRQRYAPGDTVDLVVRTRAPNGEPVPAELSVAVVDDALLSFADDDAHTLTSRVLLQADLPEPIEGVADYFAADSEEGALGLDLVLGTRGWRRFDWSPVWAYKTRRDAERAWANERRRASRARKGAAMWGADAPMDVMGDGGGGLVALGYVEMEEMVDEAPRVQVASAPVARPRPAPARPPRRAAKKNKKDAEQPVRVFADKASEDAAAVDDADASFEVRSDFRDTVLWEPAVKTNSRGHAKLTFELSDAITGFRATAQGVGGGTLGQGAAELSSTLPLSVAVRVPQELSAGDSLLLPITVENQRPGSVTAQLGLEAGALLAPGEVPTQVALKGGERRTVFAPLLAQPGRGSASVRVLAAAGSLEDGVEYTIPIAAPGFPMRHTVSGVLEGRQTHTVAIEAAVEGSVNGRLTVFPSVVSELTEGMENMLRTPGGCFEQTSSTNYPNVVILDILERSGASANVAVDRQQILKAGYGILTGYQVNAGGFETWGSGPGKEALSAYGLLQFSDMAKVFPVEDAVIRDNVRYLYKQRTGKGGFAVTGASAHGYGTAPPEVLDAYITFALVETGHHDLDRELDAQAEMSRRSEDPYRLALATMSLLATRPEAGRAAAKRLARLQDPEGSFPGSETSLTRSENQNLLVEATALSSMALRRAGNHTASSKAIGWLHEQQTSAGVWGATQGNALALKAIAEGAGKSGSSGHVVVRVDGTVAGRASYEAGQTDPMTVELTGLSAGRHTVELTLDGDALPYALEVDWTTERPTPAAGRRVEVVTTLADADVRLGETSRLTATLTNRTDRVVPDPIARIGLPAGLEAETWQLEQLKEQGKIAFFETRPREVTLYWDGISADEVHEVALDLVARVPGSFTGPASSAYPYYDDEAKSWSEGLPVRIRP